MLSRICHDMIRAADVAGELATHAFDGTDQEAAIFTSEMVPANFASDVSAGKIDKPWVRIQEVSSQLAPGTRTRRAHRQTARVILTGTKIYNTERLNRIGWDLSRAIDRQTPPETDHEVMYLRASGPMSGGRDDSGLLRILIDVEAILYEPE